eukprot:CAMPEP_0178577072 /NCGR_PEP_ID=MMETSP0697-20121206/20806_1 /TAXON_ID=265572 /ORGANISM="Extubocellulus spinifer, Strain CCMP396" /LENGTH=210 /DNA_ID=CAMNT_0020212333 /DNA_START=1 /DNA_END=630 /DNA_ORIENTATION=-
MPSLSFRSLLRVLVVAATISSPCVHAFSVIKKEGTTVSRRDAVGNAAAAALTAPLALLIPNPLLISLPVNAVDLSEFLDGPRGLKYQVTKVPRCIDCATPERAQKVKALYTLWLGGFPEDGGKQIDSSKGILGEKPFEFYAGVSQVIKGWDLAILDMREGEQRRLIVPSDLGYGSKGAGGRIPGDSTLYFEVELVEVGEKLNMRPEQVQW